MADAATPNTRALTAAQHDPRWPLLGRTYAHKLTGHLVRVVGMAGRPEEVVLYNAQSMTFWRMPWQRVQARLDEDVLFSA